MPLTMTPVMKRVSMILDMLEEEMMTSAQMQERIGDMSRTYVCRALRYLSTENRQIHVGDWMSPPSACGKGQPIPLWKLGNLPDVPMPTKKSTRKLRIPKLGEYNHYTDGIEAREIRQRILRALAKKPMTPIEIQKKEGLTSRRTELLLEFMADRGHIEVQRMILPEGRRNFVPLYGVASKQPNEERALQTVEIAGARIEGAETGAKRDERARRPRVIYTDEREERDFERARQEALRNIRIRRDDLVSAFFGPKPNQSNGAHE